MEDFEYILMDKDDFDKNGIDYSKFEKLCDTKSFYEVAYGMKYFYYMDPYPGYWPPFTVKEIEIPTGKVMIIGYY